MTSRSEVRTKARAGAATNMLLTTMALLPFHIVLAAEPANESRRLDEIVVVAQKREQSLQDVPLSLSVWSGDKIEAANLADLQELSSYVPNLTVQDAPITDVIAIRGIQSYLNPGFEQSVGMFSDGVYRGRGVQSRFAFLDVERVEVLRGPQDTLFGNNTVAGALILTSRQPTEEPHASMSVLHEIEHEETVWRGQLSGPLADGLSGRVALIDRRMSDGWVFNRFYSEPAPAVDEWAARGILRFESSESTSFMLRYEHGEFDSRGDPTEIFVVAPPLGPGAPNGGEDGIADLVSNAGNRSTEIDGGTALSTSGAMDEAVLEIKHGLGTGDSITGILAYSKYDFDRFYDADANPYDAIGLFEPEEFDQTSLELRYEQDRGAPLRFLAGAYYLDANLTNETFGGLNVVDPLTTLFFGDVDGDGDEEYLHVSDPAASALANAAAAAGDPTAALLSFMSDFTRYTLLDQRTKSLAIFGEANWDISDRFVATLGLRYTSNDKNGTQAAYCLPFGSRSGLARDRSCELLPDLPAIFSTASMLDPANPDPNVLASLASLVNGRELALIAESIAHVTPLNRDEGFVSGHIGLQWDLSPTAMMFASARKGIKDGGFNAFALAPGAVEYDEEEVLSVEIGAKLTLLDGAAEVNATVYKMDYENLQVSQFTGNTSFVVANAAEATVRGLEFESRWQITDALALRGEFAVNDFEFDRYPNAGCTVPQIIQSGRNAAECSSAGINDLSGRPAPRAPETTASLSLNHTLPIGEYQLRSTLDWSWRDEQYGAGDLDPATLNGSYAIVSFNAGFGPTDGRWQISVVGKNLTNDDYSVVADDIPLFPLNYGRGQSRPRSVGVRFGWEFF